MAKSSESQVNIPEWKQQTVSVELIGVTGLIVNRFGEIAAQKLADSQGDGPKLKRPPRQPDEEFRDKLYLLKGDRWGDLSQCVFGFPTRSIKLSLVTAGMRFAGEKSTHLLGMITPARAMVEILSPHPPEMRMDLGRLQGIGRTANLIYRPEFDPWSVEVPLTFNPDFISLAQLLNLVRIAGITVGLGDWRVDHRGVNGQFGIGRVRSEE